ncbi:DNA polymerase I [Metasolibacillus meyeri]|uniref:DNA polymerase I n=1 Tax=Metasolibacillus meyeri TaxID=1071052 RepID=A0AAW9NXH0_9BACL|nr:DNA polymerase I [Metasolibacillus meyeri]MEC1180414.1 DNA polymerase I [Metasolibacillus meyeri]
MSKRIQNVLVAFIMATSMTALFQSSHFEWMKTSLFHIPVLFVVIFLLGIIMAEDVRNAFKKVLWFDKRKDPRPIWQVGVGMIFYFAQIGFVEVFMRSLMPYYLGGMPLYLVISFLNAFLLTVIFEEIFYKKSQPSMEQYKFKKLK